MKNTSFTSESATSVVLPLKRRSVHNGSARKGNNSGRTAKYIHDRPRMSRKVHSNINFSKLDEVCLDVGKVDLSYSARLRNDTALSPQKGFPDINGEIHELEPLDHPKRRSFGPSSRVSSTVHSGADDQEWKGWSSSILFSEHHGCPFVRVKEGSKVSEVLVMTEDLVDCECKMLESKMGYKLNRKNFEKVIFGSCASVKEKRNTLEERKAELKDKLRKFFADTRELHCFLEGAECLVSSPQKDTFNRRLNFIVENNGLPSRSSVLGQGVERQKSNTDTSLMGTSVSAMEGEKFIGFTDHAVFSSAKRAQKFKNFYKKLKGQNGTFV